MMRRKITHSHSQALPLHSWAMRGLYAGLLCGSLLVLILSKYENPQIRQVQSQLSGAISPVEYFLSNPMRAVQQGFDNFSNNIERFQNIDHLQKENEILQLWKGRAELLERENRSLRKLLQVSSADRFTDMAAKVYGQASGPYSHQIKISAGLNQQVQPHMAAVTQDGLVGRIISVTPDSSDILSITDINARVAVLSSETNEHAVVKGRGDDVLELHYLPNDSKLKIGEKLYTSGEGKLMPSDILVGTVTSITKNTVLVTPAVDRHYLHMVKLLTPHTTR